MPAAISIEKLTAGYNGDDILRGLTLSLSEGDFLGAIGPNGSGKSTLIRALTGYLPVRSGRVEILGRNLRTMTRREIARDVSVVPQFTNILFDFTARDIVNMGRSIHVKRWSRPSRHDLEVVERCLELTDTAHLADKMITQLSGGDRQRVLIAKALAQEPRVLLLDEPTAHLDINHQVEIFELLLRLNREDRISILCVSHDLNLAAEYCDRIALITDGQVSICDAPKVVMSPDILAAAYHSRVRIEINPDSGRPYVLVTRKEAVE